MVKRFKASVLFMDENTEGYFEEGGLKAIEDADEQGKWVNYEIKYKEFNTEAERQAYIDGVYDSSSWPEYTLLSLKNEPERKAYTVWVGGVEVNDYCLDNIEDAERLADMYREGMYDDVVVQEITL